MYTAGRSCYKGLCVVFAQLTVEWCLRIGRGCFFFFQAEDGIRDLTVTGVQTCALPISEVADSASPVLRSTRFAVTSGTTVPEGSRMTPITAPVEAVCAHTPSANARLRDRKSVV